MGKKLKKRSRLVKTVVVVLAIGLMVLIRENFLAISVHVLVDILFPSLDE